MGWAQSKKDNSIEEAYKPVTKEDANEYLLLIEAQLGHSTMVLFNTVMYEYMNGTKDAATVVRQVVKLFRGHDDLLLNLSKFLPELRINKEDIKRMNEEEDKLQDEPYKARKAVQEYLKEYISLIVSQVGSRCANEFIHILRN